MSDVAIAALSKIAALHFETFRSVSYDGGQPNYTTRCVECQNPAPCPTLRLATSVAPATRPANQARTTGGPR